MVAQDRRGRGEESRYRVVAVSGNDAKHPVSLAWLGSTRLGVAWLGYSTPRAERDTERFAVLD